MLKGIITISVPEKICKAEIYDMIKKTKVICVVDGKLHIKNEQGIWPGVSDIEAKLLIRSLFADQEWQSVLNDGIVGNIIKSLKTDPDLQWSASMFKNRNLLKVKNGVWNIPCETLEAESDKQFFARFVDVELTNEMHEESQVFVDFCKKVFSESYVDAKKQVLYEIIGYCISDTEAIKGANFFIGPANCGKSIILKFLQKLIGENHISNVSFSGFAQKFSLAEMQGKTLNISGEVPSGTMVGKALDVFKSITGGDRIQMERKGIQPFSITLDTKLIFAGNTLPTFDRVDGTNSLIERLHILIFDKEVPAHERDPKLLDKLWNDRNKIIRYAVKALNDFEKRGCIFNLLPDEDALLDDLRETSNPIIAFIEAKMERGEEYAVHISEAYDAYRKFAADEALMDLDRTTFRSLMATQSEIKVGKTKRRLGTNTPKVCFEGIRLKNQNKKM